MSRLTAVFLAAGLCALRSPRTPRPPSSPSARRARSPRSARSRSSSPDAVVAFGDPRLADPFAISCQGAVPAGTGRWASDRVWVYDFREALPPGHEVHARCFVPSGSRASRRAARPRAAPLTGPREFAFSTGGPAIVSMQPGDGAEIEEDQHFLIRLNGPAVEASVLANARCEVEGIGERLPLVLLGGEQRAQLLKARRIAPGAVAAAC